LFDSNGNLLVIGDVYGGFINGISSCFIFQTIVDNISGGDKVSITTEYGPSSDGSCLDCIPITPTPTVTPTMTPTPTQVCLCNAYTISNFSYGFSVVSFNDCSDNRLVDGNHRYEALVELYGRQAYMKVKRKNIENKKG
jgi:hypothetical protein